MSLVAEDPNQIRDEQSEPLFGSLFQDLRKAERKTLRELSEALSVSVPFLSDVEHGRRNPLSLEQLNRLFESNILNLSDEDIEQLRRASIMSRHCLKFNLKQYNHCSRELLTTLALNLKELPEPQVEAISEMLEKARKKFAF